MKNIPFFSLLVAALVGCASSEQAPGYDAASRRAAENLAKAGNDINKLSAEDRAALEKSAKGYPGGGGMQAPAGGAPAGNSGMPQGYGTPNGG